MKISCYAPLVIGDQDDREIIFPSFGAMLRFLRKRSRLPQQAIAETLGVSQSTLSGWERLAEPPNDPFLMGLLSDFFDVPNADIEAKRLRIPYTPHANPYAPLFDTIRSHIRLEDVGELSELVKEWATWPPRVRSLVREVGLLSSGGANTRRRLMEERAGYKNEPGKENS